jgi:molecular chaperone DnaJ
MGEPGINGGGRGDLLVTILVDKHAIFSRQEYDLYSTEKKSLFHLSDCLILS